MVAVLHVVALLGLVFVNTAIAALGTRFFRVRLHTSWGSALYTATLLPVVLLVITLLVGGVIGLGPDLGTPAAVVGLTIVVPLALGVAFDYFWMPAPEDVDLPQTGDRRRPRSRRE